MKVHAASDRSSDACMHEIVRIAPQAKPCLLSAEKMSPFKLYQYLLNNTTDQDVIR